MNSAQPSKAFNGGRYPGLTNGQRRVFVHLPLPGVRGRTIASATLSVPVKDSWASQTLTATPITGPWTERNVTWNVQPPVGSTHIATATPGAKTDGQRVEIDVTAHVQAVADGEKHYGWRITTSSSAENHVYGFDSPHESWVLTYSFVEAPEVPTNLSPNGGIQGIKPVVTCDFTDLGGQSTEQASIQVQIGHMTGGGTTFTVDWDSGEQATNVPELDLATAVSTISSTVWPGVAANTVVYWRCKVKDAAGYWSPGWSDVAQWTYAPKPSLILDNPAAGIVWDPTPTIAFHIPSGEIIAYRVRVCAGDDKTDELYDSGKQPGTGTAAVEHTIPRRADYQPGRPLVGGRTILKDDQDYWLNVRVWDRLDRITTTGHATHTEVWVRFHMDDDATAPAPEDCRAEQIGDSPRVRVSWTRSAGVATGWVIKRDGDVIARLEVDEVEVDGTQYAWVDSTATPYAEHEYNVRAIDGGKRTPPSPSGYVTPEVLGLWLLNETDEVVIDGEEVGGFRTLDRRASYKPINAPYNVDLVYAFEGVTGDYAGTIQERDDQAWADARAVLMRMKKKPNEAVQIVYGTTSVPVELSNVSVSVSPAFLSETMEHDVTFTVQQVEDFEVTV